MLKMEKILVFLELNDEQKVRFATYMLEGHGRANGTAQYHLKLCGASPRNNPKLSIICATWRWSRKWTYMVLGSSSSSKLEAPSSDNYAKWSFFQWFASWILIQLLQELICSSRKISLSAKARQYMSLPMSFHLISFILWPSTCSIFFFLFIWLLNCMVPHTSL